MKLKLDNLQTLSFIDKELHSLEKKLEFDIVEIFKDTAKKINTEINYTAPVGKRPTDPEIISRLKDKNMWRHRRVKDSFPISVRRHRFGISVGAISISSWWILHFLEYGTLRTKPQPFLRRAFEKKTSTLRARIKNELGV